MNYSHITDDMTWSYSRITSYEDCPYKFFLKYIRNVNGRRHFFSDYGSFMHLIIQKYLDKELTRRELPDYYLLNFRANVIGKAPNKNIFHNYFRQGLEYLKNIEEEDHIVLGVEKEISFKVADKNFVGYIDKVSKTEDGIIVTDNKSRALSPRSGKNKPTKQDRELDNYLRQLYLYSIAVEDEFGAHPTRLVFNCFRIQTQISEPFVFENFEKTKDWALGLINRISEESDWKPDIEWFKCKYLCDVCDNCEYFQMFG